MQSSYASLNSDKPDLEQEGKRGCWSISKIRRRIGSVAIYSWQHEKLSNTWEAVKFFKTDTLFIQSVQENVRNIQGVSEIWFQRKIWWPTRRESPVSRERKDVHVVSVVLSLPKSKHHLVKWSDYRSRWHPHHTGVCPSMLPQWQLLLQRFFWKGCDPHWFLTGGLCIAYGRFSY